MHRHLHCFSLVIAALLLSVSSPVQLAIPLYISDALAQAQTIQNRKVEADRLSKNGLQQINRDQVREALESYQQALAIYREIGDRRGEKGTLNDIGNAYEMLSQYAQALDAFHQALAISRELHDHWGEGRTLNAIGLIYNYRGHYHQALQSFQQALVISREISDRAGEGVTLGNIGLVYSNQGQYRQALEFKQQALAIMREVGDRASEGRTLGNIGTVYNSLGQYAKALEFYQQSLAISREVGDRSMQGTLLNNIGRAYDSQGQYPQALEFYQQALAISKEIGDRTGEGVTLSNIGSVYWVLGQYLQALEFLQQALAISREIGNRRNELETLNSIGLVYNDLRLYPQALQSFEQALAISKEISDREGAGVTLSNIGLVYSNQGRYRQALEFKQQSLAISREVGDRASEGRTLGTIGAVYNSLGQYGKALEFYQQSLAISREVNDREMEGTTLSNIGFALLQTGKLAEATETLRAGIEVWESLRPGLSDASKVSIFDKQDSTYRFLQQALIAQNKIEAALEIAERGRARAFVELLAKQVFSQDATQLTVKSPTIQQIQQIVKEQNATLVEYSIIYDRFQAQGKEQWRQSKLFIWIAKPTGEVAFKQVDLKSLNTSLEDLVETSRDAIGVRGRSMFEVTPVAKPESDQTQRLQQLHKLLIEPIAQFLPTNPSDRVIFIPQNELFLVPFPALKDASGKYLIEKHTILTAPAIQVLELTRNQRQQVAGKDVLVVGNPTMPSISPKIGEPPQKLASLPSAQREAEAIAQLFNTKALTGNQATKSAILQQLPSARIIHLATHGLLDDVKGQGVPGAIALAPSGTGELNDGLLTSNEIFDMKLNAELVVLSACDTGRGDITGDGVIGLSRSLISAGVPSVIVSLWSVPDAPTASLMTEFYRQLQQNPDKATALRQAMLTTMKQHPNPRNWAAFTLIGEAD